MKLFTNALMKKGLIMRLLSNIWVLLPVLAVFLSCNGHKKAAMNESDAQSSDSPLTLIVQGNYAGTDTVTTHVIASQKALAKFFSAVNKTRKPGIPVPKIDFSENIVVVYCAGNDGNGSNPTLDLSNETDTEMVLGMANKTTKNVVSNTVSPFSLYTMPLTSKKISFKAVE